MSVITELIPNVIMYITVSSLFLVVGYITGKDKAIGYILTLIIIIYAIYIVVSGISLAIDTGVSIWNGYESQPLIGSFMGGWTGIYWYNTGKKMA